MYKLIEAFWRREDGAGLTEYVVMAGGIAVAALVAVNGFSNTVADEWDGISGSMVWSTPAVSAIDAESAQGTDEDPGEQGDSPEDDACGPNVNADKTAHERACGQRGDQQRSAETREGGPDKEEDKEKEKDKEKAQAEKSKGADKAKKQESAGKKEKTGKKNSYCSKRLNSMGWC